jgi:UDP-glucose 4-epimerase
LKRSGRSADAHARRHHRRIRFPWQRTRTGAARAGHEVVPLGRDVTGDIARFSDWRARLAGAGAVVHLAALAHTRGVDETRLRAVNVEASLALGRAAAAAGARMLFMSSVKVLGEETPTEPFNESSVPAPRDAYGRAKAEAEAALRAVPGLALTVLRPPLVYGPGVKANFLALARAVARGLALAAREHRNRRSLLYAGNLADAVARCLESPAVAGRTYCCATARRCRRRRCAARLALRSTGPLGSLPVRPRCWSSRRPQES